MADRPPLLAEKLGFFGAVAASLSHELKNVLATINELSGLIEDQTAVADAGRPLRPEQLKRACGNIAKQVQRGSGLVERLNFFAHSVDSPVAQVELSALLHRICDICDRLASLRRVILERRISTEPLVMNLDPFALQHVVYLVLRVAFNAAEPGQIITLTFGVPAPTGTGCVLAIASPGPLGVPGRDLVQSELMGVLVAELGAGLTVEPAPGQDSVTLTWR